MCPFMRKYRDKVKYDITGKMIDYTIGYYCVLDKHECIHCTKVTVINKACQTDVTRTRPDGSELLILDEEGNVSRHGASIL